MGKLPHQLSRLDYARGLPVSQPLHSPLGMQGWRRGMRVRLARLLDRKVAPGGQGALARLRLVPPHQAWLDQRGLYVEGVRLVQHGLDEALDGVLGGAEGAEPWNPESPGGGAEDQIAAPGIPAPKVRQRRVHDVEGPHEVGLKLVAQVVLVLVLARADDAVPRAVDHNVYASKAVKGPLDNGTDGVAGSHVAHSGQAAGVVVVHGQDGGQGRRLEDAAGTGDEVIVGEGGLDEGAADVACSTEDLLAA